MAAIASASIALAVHGTARWYLLGVAHAGLIAAGLHLANSAFLANDREAIWQLRGAWGEENTRSELQTARRKRLIWGWVDSITLRAGDLDHVVIPRNGGLLALDSKWRNEVKTSDVDELTRAALRAKTRAEGLARTLLTSERGARHRAKLPSLSVTPVVVMWGAAQHTVPENTVIDGVVFVGGRRLVRWLRSLDGDPVPKESAQDALDRLTEYRVGAWQDR